MKFVNFFVLVSNVFKDISNYEIINFHAITFICSFLFSVTPSNLFYFQSHYVVKFNYSYFKYFMDKTLYINKFEGSLKRDLVKTFNNNKT